MVHLFFTLILTSMFPVVAQAATLWQESFENGLVNWDVSACWYGRPEPAEPERSRLQREGCGPNLNSERASHGSFSLKSPYHPTDPEIQQGTYYDRLIPSSSNVWLRIDQWMEGSNGSGDFRYSAVQTKHVMLRGWDPGLAVWIVNQWGNPNPIVVANNAPSIDLGTNYFQNVGNVTALPGRWNCLIVHVDRGTKGQPNGVLELSINDQKVVEQRGLVLETTEDVCGPSTTCNGQRVAHSFDMVRVFQQYGSGNRYQDNIIVATHPLTCSGTGTVDTTPPTRPSGLAVR